MGLIGSIHFTYRWRTVWVNRVSKAMMKSVYLKGSHF